MKYITHYINYEKNVFCFASLTSNWTKKKKRINKKNRQNGFRQKNCTLRLLKYLQRSNYVQKWKKRKKKDIKNRKLCSSILQVIFPVKIDSAFKHFSIAVVYDFRPFPKTTITINLIDLNCKRISPWIRKKKLKKPRKRRKWRKKKLYHFPQNAKNDPFRRWRFGWKNARKASELETKRKVASIVGWVTFRDYITPRGQSSCYSADPRCAPRLIWATNWMSLTRGCAMGAKWPENGQRFESHRESWKSSRKSSVFFRASCCISYRASYQWRDFDTIDLMEMSIKSDKKLLSHFVM